MAVGMHYRRTTKTCLTKFFILLDGLQMQSILSQRRYPKLPTERSGSFSDTNMKRSEQLVLADLWGTEVAEVAPGLLASKPCQLITIAHGE